MYSVSSGNSTLHHAETFVVFLSTYFYNRTLDPLPIYIFLWFSGVPSGESDPPDPPTYNIMLSDDSITGSPVLDKKGDDRIISHDSHVAASSHDEPIVTRRELWSYYCKSSFNFLSSLRGSNSLCSVYYNGDAVRPSKFSFHPRKGIED